MFEHYAQSEWCDAKVVNQYEQPKEGICSTLVIRWIKYKLLGDKNFWASLTEEKVATAMKRQAYYESKMLEEGKNESFTGAASATFAFKTLLSRQEKVQGLRPKQEKLRKGFAGLQRTVRSGRDVHPWTADAPRIIAVEVTRQGCATYVFLASSKEGNRVGHVLGTYCSDGSVFFFDPNMGEIEVPSQNFAEWFEELKSGCWDQDESYQALDRYLVTHVRGIRDSSFTVGTQDDWESDGFAPRPDVTSKQDEDLLLLEGLLDEEL